MVNRNGGVALCAYDGTEFAGWQKQPNGHAVQDKIEEALEKIFGSPVRTIGSGRTDAGVHAIGQVFHFDAPWMHPLQSLLQAMRTYFPTGISPLELKGRDERFSRFAIGSREKISIPFIFGLGYARNRSICLLFKRKKSQSCCDARSCKVFYRRT